MNVDQVTSNLGQIITAIGGLGTAAFGLLEACKPVMPWINRIGFGGIRDAVAALSPEEANANSALNALPKNQILDSVRANWVNGTDLASQKAIAKSLVKLHLNAGNAAALAAQTSVDATVLKTVATKTAAGTALLQPESDLFSRFDLIVTAQLDAAYQHADQVYRNWTRALAAMIAVLLAVAGGWALGGKEFWSMSDPSNLASAVLVGLLATPLAPIAKDISTALATAANTMQLVKKAGSR